MLAARFHQNLKHCRLTRNVSWMDIKLVASCMNESGQMGSKKMKRKAVVHGGG